MLTEKDYCDKYLSATLEEMGFRGFGHFYYKKDSSKLIATYQLLSTRIAKAFDQTLAVYLYDAQKWLREEKGIMVYPQYLTNGQTWMCMVYEEKKMLMHSVGRGSYNEVLNEGIKKAVKILKEK